MFWYPFSCNMVSFCTLHSADAMPVFIFLGGFATWNRRQAVEGLLYCLMFIRSLYRQKTMTMIFKPANNIIPYNPKKYR